MSVEHKPQSTESAGGSRSKAYAPSVLGKRHSATMYLGKSENLRRYEVGPADVTQNYMSGYHIHSNMELSIPNRQTESGSSLFQKTAKIRFDFQKPDTTQ
jgi:hypothetical protein